MLPLTRTPTRSSIFSFWSDSNSLVTAGATMNLHSVAKPLMRLLYHRQAKRYIQATQGWDDLSEDNLDVYMAYLACPNVGMNTKFMVVAALNDKFFWTDLALTARLVCAPYSDVLIEMLDMYKENGVEASEIPSWIGQFNRQIPRQLIFAAAEALLSSRSGQKLVDEPARSALCSVAAGPNSDRDASELELLRASPCIANNAPPSPERSEFACRFVGELVSAAGLELFVGLVPTGEIHRRLEAVAASECEHQVKRAAQWALEMIKSRQQHQLSTPLTPRPTQGPYHEPPRVPTPPAQETGDRVLF
ncbi:hypothetical protein MKEN_01451700 [Mycena kentingensis (nom. inval.)]|nr:hypothetical protein MKEN_01451700 [Mycena kentingensis (nom. inval.)]